MRPFSRSPQARPEIETYITPDGACFLFDPTSGEGYALDQLGALVWDYCDGQSPQQEIAAEVATLLPDHPQVAERVYDLLASFAAQGLLLVDTAASSAAPSEPGAQQPQEGAT